MDPLERPAPGSTARPIFSRRLTAAAACALGAATLVAAAGAAPSLPAGAACVLIGGALTCVLLTVIDVAGRRRMERRHAVLAGTIALITSADHETKVCEQLTRTFVPELADWCTVDLLDASGETIVRAAAAHRDPAQAASLLAAPAPRVRKDRTVGTVGSTSEPQPQRNPNPISLAVPLQGRRGVIGVLTLGMTGRRQGPDGDQFQLARDVATQAALVIENAALLRQTAETSRAKDEFLAVLGHELRNPLAPMVTALSLMEMKGYAGLEKEYRVLERQVRHMSRLVDDLLDVTRIARGKMELRLDAVDLAEAVSDGVEIVRPLLDRKALFLDIDIEHARFGLRGDRTRLAQVMANLLHNAAKWSNVGQTIDVRARAEAGGVALSIRDRGAGISGELLPRIFDLFAQAPQPRARTAGGLGVGLALVKSVVALHGGTVVARSDGLGRGSEFTVWLPASVTVASSPSKVERSTLIETDGQGDGLRVLVVDDNVDAAESMGDLLRAHGFIVRVAHDGPAALRAVDDFRLQVAVLDIGLPAMDGYELAEHLSRRVPGVRLIAVTGYARPVDLARSKASGFERHLAKPVDWSALKAALLEGSVDDRGGRGAGHTVSSPRPV